MSGPELIAPEVLKIIYKNPRQTPQLIHSKVTTSVHYVRNTLAFLNSMELVDAPYRGIYVPTDFGKFAHLFLQLDEDTKTKVIRQCLDILQDLGGTQ